MGPGVGGAGALTPWPWYPDPSSGQYITVTYYTIVKSSVPLWILLFSIWLGLQKPRLVMFLILVVIGGGITLASLDEGTATDAETDAFCNDTIHEHDWCCRPPPSPPSCTAELEPPELGVNASIFSARRLHQMEHQVGLAIGALGLGNAQMRPRWGSWPEERRGQGRWLDVRTESTVDGIGDDDVRLGRRMRAHPQDEGIGSKLIGLLLVLGASLCGGFRWACTQLLLQALPQV